MRKKFDEKLLELMYENGLCREIDCTDEEKALLREYLKYNGYTAGFCGPIDMTGFVRANIIRYNDYIDTLELFELNEELKKGVYL